MKKVLMIAVVLLAVSVLYASGETNKVIPTMLKITVLDNIGNVVPGAVVTLYKTAGDYEKEINPVQSDTTNNRGKAFFKGLEPISYYMQVVEGDKSNIGGGEMTAELEEGRINKANVVIE